MRSRIGTKDFEYRTKKKRSEYFVYLRVFFCSHVLEIRSYDAANHQNEPSKNLRVFFCSHVLKIRSYGAANHQNEPSKNKNPAYAVLWDKVKTCIAGG